MLNLNIVFSIVMIFLTGLLIAPPNIYALHFAIFLIVLFDGKCFDSLRGQERNYLEAVFYCLIVKSFTC